MVLTPPACSRVTRRIAADPTCTALLLATLFTRPPHRTPGGYVSELSWDEAGLPAARGTLTLESSPGANGCHVTFAVLELEHPGVAPDELAAARLRATASAFLKELGRAAEQRSRAA